MLSYTGHVRVYYNRSEDEPRVWSIDDGKHSWELQVQHVRVIGLKSAYQKDAKYPDPKAWFYGVGIVEISEDGITATVRSTEWR